MNKLLKKIVSIFFILAFWANCNYAQLIQADVQLLGAANQVSGSCYYFETDQKNFLVDCGLFYPETKDVDYQKDITETNRLNSQMPVSPKKISAIIITHAHLDHIGKIPLLVKNGYNGKIFSTGLTKQLSMIMFEMLLKGTSLGSEIFTKSANSNKVHSQVKCEWRNRIKRPKNVKMERDKLQDSNLQLCKVCLGIELANLEKLFKTIEYNSPYSISKDISFELFDAKHIPGSASVLVNLNLLSGQKSVYITGDIGSGLDNILSGKPKTPKLLDYVFIESTYGGRSRNLSSDPFNEFFYDLNKSLTNNHFVWVPCFVLDRTQKVLNVIKKGQQRNKLPKKINIKVVSPSAKKINQVYDQYFEYRPNKVDEKMSMSPKNFTGPISGPMLLITPSYIDQLDFFHPVVEKILKNNKSDLMLVGYQDPRSVGGILKDISTGSRIHLGEKKIKVSAKIKYYGGIFSGHIDSKGVISYLKDIEINEAIMLVHGDVPSLSSLKKSLKPLFKNNVIIPENNWSLTIK